MQVVSHSPRYRALSVKVSRLNYLLELPYGEDPS